MRVDRGLPDMMRGNTLNAMIVHMYVRSLEFSHCSILAMVSAEWYDVVVPSLAPEYLNLDLVAANDTLVVDTEANVLLSGAWYCGNLHNSYLRLQVGASQGMAMSLRRSVRIDICTDWHDGHKLASLPYKEPEYQLDACCLLYALYAAADTFVTKVTRKVAQGELFSLSINVLIQSGFRTGWIQLQPANVTNAKTVNIPLGQQRNDFYWILLQLGNSNGFLLHTVSDSYTTCCIWCK